MILAIYLAIGVKLFAWSIEAVYPYSPRIAQYLVASVIVALVYFFMPAMLGGLI